MAVDVALSGTLVNQPPHADAGVDQVLECTSSAGASFLLEGSASSDPDGNLALSSWRRGSRVGPAVSDNLTALASLGVGEDDAYVLRVIDSYAQTDEDDTHVGIVDTTPPVISCNAPPTVRPPSHPVSFTSTAVDVCDDDVPAEILSYDCFKIAGNGKIVDKKNACDVVLEGDTITIRNKSGDGDHVQWVVAAQDDTGNAQQVTCEIVISN